MEADFHNARARPEGAAPQGSGRKLRLSVSLLRHWKMGLAAGTAVFLLGVPLAWLKGKPRWRTEGVLYVSPRFLRNLDTDPEQDFQSNSQYREFVQQQVRAFARYDIIRAVVVGPAGRYWRPGGGTERRRVDMLRGALEVAPVPDSYLITIGLSGEKAEGLAELVNAAIESYVRTARAETTFDVESRLRNLEMEKAGLEIDIQKLMDERTGIARELGTTVFSADMTNSYDRMLGTSSEALMEARRQRFAAEAAAPAAATDRQPGEGARAEGLDKALSDPGLNSLKSTLNQRRGELMARMAGLSPRHAGRIAAENEIAQIDREIERVTLALRDRVAVNLETERRSAFEQAARVEKKLEAETQALREQAEAYSHAYQRSIEIGEEIDRARKRLNSIEDRLGYLRLESKAPGFVRVFSAALAPDLPIAGGRKKLAAMVAAAALLLALLVPVAKDLLDPRVKAPAELAASTGLPLTGWLPEGKPGSRDPDAADVIRMAVSVRRRIGNLPRAVIVVTPLHAGGGGTTVALAIGGSLQRLGVRTLVVEANPLSPDARYGDSGRPGLLDVLNGSVSLSSCVVGASAQLPDRVATGQGIVEDLLPAENILPALESSGYDLVLIDAAAIGTSLATEELVRVVGAALVVVDAQRDTKKDVAACLNHLDRLHLEAFGSILNKVPADPAWPWKRRSSKG